ncbi:MAG: hypothetical protein RLZZ271_750, partial [Pseudomonadota bacterium]
MKTTTNSFPAQVVPHALRLLPVLVAAAFNPAEAAPPVNALPTNGQIVAGQGSISQAGNVMSVRQNSNQMIANWQSFNVGQSAVVNFLQPSSSAVALNRVLSANPSQIFGQINANGQVILVNPSGVLFGPSARLDVGGLVASSLGMSDADFLMGRFKFSSAGNAGAVVNQGEISAKEGGFVALVGASVVNTGSVSAPSGQVALVAGNDAQLQIGSTGLLGVKVDSTGPATRIDNSGLIAADGGKVWLTASSAAPLVSSAINQTGSIRANAVGMKNGEIWIEANGGEANLSGQIQATGAQTGQTGGRIVATANKLTVDGNARIDASGAAGGGTVLLGGGWQGKDASVSNANTTLIKAGASIAANATASGDGGTVVAWADNRTTFDGNINAKGAGSGNGGKVETSGKNSLGVSGLVNVAGGSPDKGGEWLLDPDNIIVAATGTDMTPPGFTASGSQTITSSSVASALNAGGTVSLNATDNITIDDAVSKSSGTDASLKLLAGGDITVNKDISSVSGKLNVDFGSAGLNSGTTYMNAQVSTNGGDAVFYKATELNAEKPVSTKVLAPSNPLASTPDSGSITFHKLVTLTSSTPTVILDTQSAQNGVTYLRNGGAITFNSDVISADANYPIGLVLNTTGAVQIGGTNANYSGAVTFNGKVGTDANPLDSLQVSGPTQVLLNTSEMNFKKQSGTVLTFSAPSPYTPQLVLGSAGTTNINVKGFPGSGTVASADYAQSTFDIVNGTGAAATLNINSDASIQITGSPSQTRSIAGTALAPLAVNLNPNQFSGANSGSVELQYTSIKTYGGALNLGSSSARATGVAAQQNTDGIRIYQSDLITCADGSCAAASASDGDLNLYGRTATANVGGDAIHIYGLSNLKSGQGDLTLDGRVDTVSASASKDAVVIG